MAHIPAPLTVERVENRHTSDAGDGKTHPSVAGWRCSVSQYEQDPQAEEARANLFSAAPDLLEACKIAENWLAEYETGPDCGLHGLLEQIRAAIAKAEIK